MIPPSYTQKYVTALEKVEVFAHRLLFWEFEDLNDLWTMQLNVMYLILDIQKEITRLKTQHDEIRKGKKRIVNSKEGNWKSVAEDLNQTLREVDVGNRLLQRARGMAQRVGDTLVWLWLNHDTNIIGPLANGPKSSVPEGVGLTGMGAIAAALANEGVGFPLLHDATGILRVGDITFVNPGKQPTTVEIKSHDKGATEREQSFRTEIYATDQSDEFREVLSRITANRFLLEEPPALLRIRNTQGERRLARQLERMRAAVQKRGPGSKGEDATDNLIILEGVQYSANALHWETTQALIAEAYSTGSSFRVVDDCIAYAAYYNNASSRETAALQVDEWLVEALRRAEAELERSTLRMPDDKLNTYMKGDTDQNLRGQVWPLTVPCLLYRFPYNVLVDMIWGKFVVIAFVHLRRLVGVLEERGYLLEYPSNRTEIDPNDFVLKGKMHLPNGQIGQVEITNNGPDLNRMVHGFMAVEGLTQVASQAIDKMKVEIWKRLSRAEDQ